MKDQVVRAAVQVIFGAVVGFGSCWFVDEVLHLPWWLGFFVMTGIFGAIQYFANQSEQKEREQIAAAFEEQQRQLRIAKKKLARQKREVE